MKTKQNDLILRFQGTKRPNSLLHYSDTRATIKQPYLLNSVL